MNRIDQPSFSKRHEGLLRPVRAGAFALVALSCAEAPVADSGDDSSLSTRAPSALTTVAGADPALSVQSSANRLAADRAVLGQRPQVAPTAPLTERPAVLSREFACRADQVGQELRVGEVTGRPGVGIFIRPQGDKKVLAVGCASRPMRLSHRSSPTRRSCPQAKGTSRSDRDLTSPIDPPAVVGDKSPPLR